MRAMLTCKLNPHHASIRGPAYATCITRHFQVP
jgi:hypothetical protein